MMPFSHWPLDFSVIVVLDQAVLTDAFCNATELAET